MIDGLIDRQMDAREQIIEMIDRKIKFIYLTSHWLTHV